MVRAGWVAGVTRGRLLLGRTIGADHARAVARCGTLADGVGVLVGSAYGERVRAGVDLVGAERGVAETLLWHLRILAGWLPPRGAGLVRALAGWFEVANIDARLAALVSGDGRLPPPFALGGLATAWDRIEHAGSVEEIADCVAGSAWGACGRASPGELALGLRVAWARRVGDATPAAADWVAGAGALLVARELLVDGGRDRARELARLPWVGDAAVGAASLHELQNALPPRAAWALTAVSDPSELWRAELGWWSRVQRDAGAFLSMWGDEAIVLATVGLLAADAQRAALALRSAAQGGRSELAELIDAAG